VSSRVQYTLFDRIEPLSARDNQGVYEALSGITGLAQIKGINMLNPILLAKIDRKMIDSFSSKKYFMYLFYTALGKDKKDAVFS